MESVCFKDRYILRLDKGEEVVETLKNFCEKNNIKLANINAIGATNKVKVGLFNVDKKEYISKVFEGNFEITSLIGTVSTMKEETYLHLHTNFSDENCNLYGGHLNMCYISATCEMVIEKIEGKIDREFSAEIGLNLFKF